MGKQIIRSIRKGCAQWNEEDRLKLAMLLIKCGYAVQITHRVVPGQENKPNASKEYIVEYWEEKDESKQN